MSKIVSIPLAIIMTIISFIFPCKKDTVDTSRWETNYPYVFVHGLMGWGSYDAQYKIMPYWGMFKVNTDVEDYYTKHLNMINCL